VTYRRIQTNGIAMHIAEAGSGPPVVLVHGFPELWYSWRHQLPVLAEAGCHAVAADLRGCGATDVTAVDESYAVSNLAADLIGLLDALDTEQAVLNQSQGEIFRMVGVGWAGRGPTARSSHGRHA
jgi:pimeloyl-ACP methyl ester carboxylesterase